MKVHILYTFRNEPWGGGNQFLKALRQALNRLNLYTDSHLEADVIVFNSHHELNKSLLLKKRYPHKLFIHRIDGPVYKVRGMDLPLDKLIYSFNKSVADGTIFQSTWSREENYKQGMKATYYTTTIINAPDPDIFNKNGRLPFSKDRRVKLIATSWSANWRKGFEIYQYLDEKLDFAQYQMTFVGNSPIEFKNIQRIKPLESKALSEQLKQHDIFVIASRNDPCSNSLIEALHCGLPAVALNSGGHPEVVRKAGRLFEGKDDVLDQIRRVVDDYHFYQKSINLPTLTEVVREYQAFIEEILDDWGRGRYQPKIVNVVKLFALHGRIWSCGLNGKIDKAFKFRHDVKR